VPRKALGRQTGLVRARGGRSRHGCW
jgi:hypothetical protein